MSIGINAMVDIDKIKESFTEEELLHIKGVTDIMSGLKHFFEEHGSSIDKVNFDLLGKNINFVLGEKTRLTMFPMVTVDPKKGLLTHKELTEKCWHIFNMNSSSKTLNVHLMGLKDKSSIQFSIEPNGIGLTQFTEKMLGSIYSKYQAAILNDELNSEKSTINKKIKL